MSRIGRLPIVLPAEVKVGIKDKEVTVEGPKGHLSRTFHPEVEISLQDGALVVERRSESVLHRSLHGLTRSLLANMVSGVAKGFQKSLEVIGVGYRVQKAGDKLVLQVGYSHSVEFVPPPGITLDVEGTNRISVVGVDKQLVGEVAARIRAIRKPEPYKGKGIRYMGEIVRRKAGKAGKVGAKRE